MSGHDTTASCRGCTRAPGCCAAAYPTGWLSAYATSRSQRLSPGTLRRNKISAFLMCLDETLDHQDDQENTTGNETEEEPKTHYKAPLYVHLDGSDTGRFLINPQSFRG